REMGLGVVSFSPLGGGLLTGKYSREDRNPAGPVAGETAGDRKSLNAALGWVTDRNLAIAEAVKEVALELERTPAQVALAWALNAPGVTAPIIGSRTAAQLEDNLGALEVDLAPSHLARLAEVSAIDLGNPHSLLASDHIRAVTAGDLKIDARSRSASSAAVSRCAESFFALKWSSLSMGEYRDKNVVITGGSSGMGLALAQMLARDGARVVITGRSRAKLDAAQERLSRNAVAVRADVASLPDLDMLASRVESELGSLEALFVNAGISPLTPLESTTEDLYDELFAINVKGAFFTVQKLAP